MFSPSMAQFLLAVYKHTRSTQRSRTTECVSFPAECHNCDKSKIGDRKKRLISTIINMLSLFSCQWHLYEYKQWSFNIKGKTDSKVFELILWKIWLKVSEKLLQVNSNVSTSRWQKGMIIREEAKFFWYVCQDLMSVAMTVLRVNLNSFKYTSHGPGKESSWHWNHKPQALKWLYRAETWATGEGRGTPRQPFQRSSHVYCHY